MIIPAHKAHDRAKRVLDECLARRGLARYIGKMPPELIMALRDAVKELKQYKS